jgi:hypothetical protein
MTTANDQVEETTPVSAKRNFAATTASVTVTVVLGVVASTLINKAAVRVHNRIAPQPEIENN